MTWHALYSLHHTHYIRHLIYSVWCHIHSVCYSKQWLYLWHRTLYVYDIFIYMASRTVLWPHNHCVPSQPLCLSLNSVYFRHYTQCTNFMKISECMSSQHLYVWHQYSLHMTSHPLIMTSHHFIYDVKCNISNITSSLSDLTSTVSVESHLLYQWYHSHPMYDLSYSINGTSYPLYLWHHIHYVWQHNTVCGWYHTWHMCDIICTTDDITSTLSHQTTVFMMSHPLQAWHQTHCIRHCTHCIFVIRTSPLLSYPPLYDIIRSICVTSYALYITSYQLLMSSHYSTYDSTTSIYETTSSM